VKWVAVQPSWLARTFICAANAARLPEVSLASTLAASLALGRSIAYIMSMRRTVSPACRPMVWPRLARMDCNSGVRLSGMVMLALRSVPLSSTSRAVIILVRLATQRGRSGFCSTRVSPVSASKR